jgi:hypothetical protein
MQGGGNIKIQGGGNIKIQVCRGVVISKYRCAWGVVISKQILRGNDCGGAETRTAGSAEHGDEASGKFLNK